MSKKIEIKSIASKEEVNNRENLLQLFLNSPLPDNEKLFNTGLFLKRQELSKMLFLNLLYLELLKVQGVIIEFGVRWGQNLVTLTNLRGIYEPYNYGRKIIGFDTFEGFKNISEQDGSHKIIHDGAFSVTDNYQNYLEKLLNTHEKESPLNHLKKSIIVKGDAIAKLNDYLKDNPETIIAFAYFDFDIYKPTKECLQLILPHMSKGAILVFDELLDPQFPGETIALKEVLDITKYKIHRNPFGGLQSYIILD